MPRWSLHVIGFIATTLILFGAAPFVGGPPWWFVSFLAVGAYSGGAIGFDRAVSRMFLAPWREMGTVLSGAAVEVNSVERDAPPPAGMESLGHTGHAWYAFDVSITPRTSVVGPKAQRRDWEPSELALLDPFCEVDRNRESSLDLGTTVHAVEIWTDDGFVADPSRGIEGPARIRFLAALPADMRYARFRYALEVFGRVELAEAAPQLRQAA